METSPLDSGTRDRRSGPGHSSHGLRRQPDRGDGLHVTQYRRAGSDCPNPDRDDEPWQVQLQAQGATDLYVQQLVLAPSGYSGWHTHPGILVGTVLSGGIDFFDENCQKRSITAGQVFFENNQVHAISNPGSVNAELTIAYLVKHDAARRIEASAPACAPSTMIP